VHYVGNLEKVYTMMHGEKNIKLNSQSSVTVNWIRQFLSFNFFLHREKRLSASSCLSVRLSAWNNSAPTGRILTTFDIWFYCYSFSVQTYYLHKI